jgi:hypothetical protein
MRRAQNVRFWLVLRVAYPIAADEEAWLLAAAS